jgi:cell wall-associated NlpC family hydrolase
MVTALAPVAAALLVTAVAGPAVSEQLATIRCPGPIPATGRWRPPFGQPYTLTSGFGPRFHPVYRRWRPHTGQDLVSRPGPGPVLAAAAGTVFEAGSGGAYGTTVLLAHPGRVRTRYAHLAALHSGIAPGARVRAGQRLGVEGSTGASTGNHLHFEVIRAGRPVDPVVFMRERGAPLDGAPVAPLPPDATTPPGVEGGVGFGLPGPGWPRRASLTNPPLPAPSGVKALYISAARRYRVPWTLLAGIGMAETGHGRNNHTSSAGAQGLMQFMPATWVSMGVDGDGDGRADITSDADSVHSAANYLTRSGVTRGPAGVRRALWMYNHADWYVNDVLTYAHAYGGGTVLGDPTDCGPGTGAGNPALPAVAGHRVRAVLAWAATQAGDRYVYGANGPDAWDCSSLVRAGYARIGIGLPRTARAQRDWLAAGNGYRVRPGQERPGDLVFWDSYLGPNTIGHVMIVWDPAGHRTIEARDSRHGVGHFSYRDGPRHQIFEIWRLGNVADQPGHAP